MTEDKGAEEKGGGEEEKDKPPTTDSTIVKGTEELLSTAKWLVATFGAVGGALITGISLADLGKLDGTDQLFAALGAGVAIICVVLIIVAAAGVLSSELVNFADLANDKDDSTAELRAELNKDSLTHPGFDSVSTFVRRILKLTGDQIGLRREIADARDKGKTEDEKRARQKFRDAQAELAAFKPVSDRLRNRAQYEQVRARFRKARTQMSVLAVFAALGVGLFAFSNSAPEAEAEPAVESQPVLAIADLNDEATERLQSTIGEKCDASALRVAVTDASEESAELLAIGDGAGCRTVELSVEQDEVSIQPADDELDQEIFVP